MSERVSTGLERLDRMLGGGLLPGTLTVVYGATGIGKTHLGVGFAHHGRAVDGAPGLLFDMNARGDSQQHHEYAARLYDWPLRRWTHAVTPMADPYPPAEQMGAFYCDAFPWVGKLRNYQVPTADGLELDWNWKAMYNHAFYIVSPFIYFHLAAGSRRDSEILGMEICLPVWKHRAFIDAHRYDHARVTTLLLVTTEETQLEHLIARKVAAGDIGAVANTIIVMGSERVGNRLGRFLCVVKHRGSAKSDDIAEYKVTERGLEL